MLGLYTIRGHTMMVVVAIPQNDIVATILGDLAYPGYIAPVLRCKSALSSYQMTITTVICITITMIAII